MHNLEELYMEQLRDVYDAEHQLVEALPKMARAATSPQLQQAFEMHHQQTQSHIARLEQVFNFLGVGPKRKTCDAMQGLIKEAGDVMKRDGDSSTKDAALIAAAQRVEHYEIAAYGTLREYARELNHTRAHNLHEETLQEEKNTDQKLTKLAAGSINDSARVGEGARNPQRNDF